MKHCRKLNGSWNSCGTNAASRPRYNGLRRQGSIGDRVGECLLGRTTFMDPIFAILVGAAALGFFIWLLIPSSSPKPDSCGELIDPADSRQIGLLMGLAGGGIADAAVARFALERFEQIHGRKATTRDVGIVVGLMRGGDRAT